MRKLNLRINKLFSIYVEAKRREITMTDVTSIPMDRQLMSKYFPSIFKEINKKKKEKQRQQRVIHAAFNS